MSNAVSVVIENYFLLFLDPEFMLLLGLVVVLVALQYRRSESVRADMFGVKTSRVWRDTAAATLFGIAGGLAGSILMVLAGLPITGSGSVFILVLLIAVLLMLINPRFLCFAYAGGIVSLLNIFTGWPQVNIYQILALVALLHMVESILIFFSGHFGAVPAYFEDGSGRVAGGFTLQKFWPIPLVALTVVGHSLYPGAFAGMPEWWPLIKPDMAGESSHYEYVLVSLVAGLGYGDLAIARYPREKSRISAFYLALYSITLFMLSALAQYFRPLAIVAALFSPLGHEMVIYIGKRIEMAGRPLFALSTRGVRVLDVLADSTAWHMGIRSGDVLIALNGIPLRDHWTLAQALDHVRGPLEIEYLRGPSQAYSRGVAFRKDAGKPLGLLPLYDGGGRGNIDLRTPGTLWRRLFWWWEKNRR
ncbi:MAG: PDZ domain-containing protein [Bacillota bacterium]